MLRSVSIMVAAAMAAGALTFTPAAAAPVVRALPEASQTAASGIHDVRDRREWRRHGHWRDNDRHRGKRWRHRERRHHRRFVPAPFFHYGFPYFVPPRHHQFFVPPRHRRHHWQGRSGRH